MKFLRVIVLLVAVIVMAGCAHYRMLYEQPKYLAHNIWFASPKRIEGGGFKHQPFVIPIGTPVTNIMVCEDESDSFNGQPEYIKFNLVSDTINRFGYDTKKSDIQYTMQIAPKFFRNPDGRQSVTEFAEQTFIDQSIDEQLEGFTEMEIRHIMDGTIEIGMSKEAVLKSWGYPPPRSTRSLSDRKWRYWITKFVTAVLEFDEDGYLVKATDYGKEIKYNATIVK